MSVSSSSGESRRGPTGPATYWVLWCVLLSVSLVSDQVGLSGPTTEGFTFSTRPFRRKLSDLIHVPRSRTTNEGPGTRVRGTTEACHEVSRKRLLDPYPSLPSDLTHGSSRPVVGVVSENFRPSRRSPGLPSCRRRPLSNDPAVSPRPARKTGLQTESNHSRRTSCGKVELRKGYFGTSAVRGKGLVSTCQ